MQSQAATVGEYLASLPPDRRAALTAVRAVILKNLSPGYEEGMQYGMIGFFVPHSVFPPGYHCDPRQPLPFVCLASQKNYMSLYHGCAYGDGDYARWFAAAWAKTGKKLDMGKACIRFKRLEDLPLDVIGESIRRMPAKKYVAAYEAIRAAEPARRAARSAAKKSVPSRKKPGSTTRAAPKKSVAVKRTRAKAAVKKSLSAAARPAKKQAKMKAKS